MSTSELCTEPQNGDRDPGGRRGEEVEQLLAAICEVQIHSNETEYGSISLSLYTYIYNYI